MKKFSIINEDMMLGLTASGSWRGLYLNYNSHYKFSHQDNQWMLFDTIEKAEQYLIRLGYCKMVGDRAMQDYCFMEIETW